MKTNTHQSSDRKRTKDQKEEGKKEREGEGIIKRTESVVYGEKKKDENNRADCWDVSALPQNE